MARGRRPHARRVQTRTPAVARSAKDGEHAPSGSQGSAGMPAMQEEMSRRGAPAIPATAVPAAWTGDAAVWEAVEESLSTLTVKRRRFLKNFLATGHIANSVHAAGYNVKDSGSANDVGRRAGTEPSSERSSCGGSPGRRRDRAAGAAKDSWKAARRSSAAAKAPGKRWASTSGGHGSSSSPQMGGLTPPTVS